MAVLQTPAVVSSLIIIIILLPIVWFQLYVEQEYMKE